MKSKLQFSYTFSERLHSDYFLCVDQIRLRQRDEDKSSYKENISFRASNIQPKDSARNQNTNQIQARECEYMHFLAIYLSINLQHLMIFSFSS